MASPKPMSRKDMQRGFSLLDDEIAESDLLMSVAPIRLISVGGSLAVCIFGNREASSDIDCMLDPNIAVAEDYVDEFQQAVTRVTRHDDRPDEWLNRHLEMFVSRQRRPALFLESVDQNILLYSGPNLEIYAGRLDWALERKLRRLAHTRRAITGKDVDLSDAAALIHYMVTADPDHRPLTFEYVLSLNYNQFDVAPTYGSIRRVADHYIDTYGAAGLVELVWDAEKKKEKYLGVDGQWVWYE